ncbi:unnamed protein product [Fructobacillus cardui]|uniref:Uncharacterized protein n=1 Tax=Fructobacillus cardui TaxID=2893170 RepID=A0ABM9MTI0_9LACO|nr:unnamed protein product [Fructobacillus cardui]CAK1248643.1 unnamed protein product [Fructobacillus cardui]
MIHLRKMKLFIKKLIKNFTQIFLVIFFIQLFINLLSPTNLLYNLKSVIIFSLIYGVVASIPTKIKSNKMDS